MDKEQFLSVSQYATAKGITKQAVYKQLNNKLKPFVVEVEGKKYIDKKALLQRDNNQQKQPVEQPIEQHSTNQVESILTQQLEEKDRQIEHLLRQIETLQEQNGNLTDLLKNSQLLLAAEKQEKTLLLEQAAPPVQTQPQEYTQEQPQEETPKEKKKKKEKKRFSLFKSRKNKH